MNKLLNNNLTTKSSSSKLNDLRSTRSYCTSTHGPPLKHLMLIRDTYCLWLLCGGRESPTEALKAGLLGLNCLYS